MDEFKSEEVIEIYTKLFKLYQVKILNIIPIISKSENFLKNDFSLLYKDLDFLIFVIENFPERTNLASRLLLERIIGIRYYFVSTSNEYLSYITNKSLSTWKKNYDFFSDIILPLGDKYGFVEKAIKICEKTYQKNIELLDDQRLKVDVELRSIKSVCRKKFKKIPIRNLIEQKLFRKGVGSERLVKLYELLSEHSHPNVIIEIGDNANIQDVAYLGLLEHEINYFCALSEKYFKEMKIVKSSEEKI
jgi:hypothetical protein